MYRGFRIYSPLVVDGSSPLAEHLVFPCFGAVREPDGYRSKLLRPRGPSDSGCAPPRASRIRWGTAIQAHRPSYVLAGATNRRVPTNAGPIQVDRLPAQPPKRAWQEHSPGTGTHGHGYHFRALKGLDRTAGRR
jgi:hypothetical protein